MSNIVTDRLCHPELLLQVYQIHVYYQIEDYIIHEYEWYDII